MSSSPRNPALNRSRGPINCQRDNDSNSFLLASYPFTLSLCLPPPLTVVSILPSRYRAYSVFLPASPVRAQSFRMALEATTP